ncbi:glyoxalase [Sutcliffiella horikoshii]|uniref:Glyoxalase n=1 Tax=Sutcliffiella horikoshii TaxID=79883 RepID=A0A1Y0CJI0_9BACI|nr:VOC family protein [Sutcliffiella horikoshii]ART75421.1 glyoxalase [Sutcliffiella horikoshii]TYS54442.1 VOC family protein [Sutcliffiella horikoshii]
MTEKLWRVGTTYIPVIDVKASADWYVSKLGAELNYHDQDKAIINLADQSLFLVKAKEGQTSNFIDVKGQVRFSLTFEVDGQSALESMHHDFINKGIKVGEIENRGHVGRNFVFEDLDGNKFDVWSELSPTFRKKQVK